MYEARMKTEKNLYVLLVDVNKDGENVCCWVE